MDIKIIPSQDTTPGLWGKNVYNWPLNNTGLNCLGPLMCRFFSINIQWVLLIPRFCLCRFNLQQIEKSNFYLRLGIHPCNGPTVCIYLYRFIEKTWASLDFYILWGSWNWGMTVVIFGRVRSYMWVLHCAEVRPPNPCIVQRSTVYIILKKDYHDL